MFRFDEKELEKALSASFKKYESHGPRSTEKLKPIHTYVAKALKEIWGDGYMIHCIGGELAEYTVEGKYYPKDIDITVTSKDKPVFCLGIKFVTSNYKQNANNYFEGMMGETANIQALRNLPYAQLIILRHKTPYYLKRESYNSKKEIGHVEIIMEKDLKKYLNLAFDSVQAHRPHILGIVLIDIDEDTKKVKCIPSNELYKKEFAGLLDEKLSAERFFEEIKHYKEFCAVNKNGDII